MKYRQAKKVMADHERALRRVSEIETRRTELAIEFEPLTAAEERLKAAALEAEAAKQACEAVKKRHAEELMAAGVTVYEKAFAADQLGTEFRAGHAAILAKRAALDADEAKVRADLAVAEQQVPEAKARLAASAAAMAPCEECDGAKVVAAFCDDPKHDQAKPGVQGAGEAHECGLKIIACPTCSAPKVVRIGTGKVNPNLVVTGGSRSRHPHNALRSRPMAKVVNKETR